ncbi:LOW QUALITY PROTEIN: uncharacterized protein KIAA1614 homolog [Tyto alba]|uniref:LOW QUALITY PROTEIN: uncharacterized protein KIAA1614 homolog n=1 Tax=Tyto alba TaxID=56313 RepID=UPI001C67F9F1|nr:LOW QUALITY PROTEIN: uncharacterized protein KIAA1614 homolog [Tyto alba]
MGTTSPQAAFPLPSLGKRSWDRSLGQHGGRMEGGGSPAEARRVPRPPEQHGQSGGRTPAPPEPPEAARGPHAILESKVKALKEKRGGGRPGTPMATPERPSARKHRPRRGKAGVEVAAEPRAQLRTYLTDGLLDGGEPTAGGPPAPRAGTPGLWRVPAPRGDALGSTELPWDESSGCRGSASPRERPPLEEEARTPPRDPGGPSVSPTVAEGWDRLSLAERVERNRRLLQEVLGLAVPEVPASDGDWDSGVSLQDAEGCRAFVPGQELELSPRHEQAKQLLQRARMKARTNPLRASHDILLLLPADTTGPHPREPSGRPSVAPRDGGSLSDSSSGESSCGRPRRPRGPSPSRVRFEDESARDAEARYLERLQLRHRRALASAPSPLEPAGGGQPGAGVGQHKARSGDLGSGGKCSACGSFLGAAAGRGPDAPAAADVAKSGSEAQGSHPGDSGGLRAARPEPKTRALGPRGSPLWILPSRQRIHTEKIKETYIGGVTYIDEGDSALESTDTSDGCRTDSEEAGPRSPHPRGYRDPRARGHRAPRATPQPELRAGKETCAAGGDPRAGDGDSGGTASGTGAVCPPPSGRAGNREEGDPRRRAGGSEGVGNAARPPLQPTEPPDPSSQPGVGTPMPGTHLPTPPPPKKACSQAPCRKTLFSGGSRRASSQGARGPEPDGGGAASPQPRGTAGPGERRGPCSPRWLPGSPLRALSTNNSNNTHGQDPPGTGRGAPSPPTIAPRVPGGCSPPRRAAAAAAPGRERGTRVFSLVLGLPFFGGKSAAKRCQPGGCLWGSPNLKPVSFEPFGEAWKVLNPCSSGEKGGREPFRLLCLVKPSLAPAGLLLWGGGLHPNFSSLRLSRPQDAPPAWSPVPHLGHTVDDPRPSPRREPGGQPASRKGSSASASGLKKLLCSLSQSTKQRLGRFRCYSMEQLPAPGGPPPDSPGMKKSPSLQSLRLVSPFCQPRKAASIQSLHPLLGKAPRASAYLLPQPAADRKGGSGPRRSLSVEDIGAPGRLRAVGRVVEVFPDGTSQLELQRPPHGAFGFCVTSGHGRPDTGVYVQEMADAGTAKLYAGLLGVGDEILQVNGVAVSGLGLARIRELLLRADTLSLRVLRQRPAPQ